MRLVQLSGSVRTVPSEGSYRVGRDLECPVVTDDCSCQLTDRSVPLTAPKFHNVTGLNGCLSSAGVRIPTPLPLQGTNPRVHRAVLW